ncbi:hypothetical protein FOA52_001931 [Chlamydomonas sp. UWO 241]|nr:hypothetical protein FOA52_001931 [Chlamydomonas sp. UWO 241]
MIIAKKENGVKPENSLSPVGEEQARQAGVQLRALLDASGGTSKLIVCTSPFSRTIATARLALEGAGLPELADDAERFQLVDALMERDFSAALEKQHYSVGYDSTWAEDALSSAYKAGALQGGSDGESVDDVAARLRAMFKDLETRYQGHDIVLASHGDTLSILQCTMEGTDGKEHRRFAFGNCELRKLGSGLKDAAHYEGY